jgi:hypothetical protein
MVRSPRVYCLPKSTEEATRGSCENSNLSPKILRQNNKTRFEFWGHNMSSRCEEEWIYYKWYEKVAKKIIDGSCFLRFPRQCPKQCHRLFNAKAAEQGPLLLRFINADQKLKTVTCSGPAHWLSTKQCLIVDRVYLAGKDLYSNNPCS